METTSKITTLYDDTLDRSANGVYASPVSTPYYETGSPKTRGGGYQFSQYVTPDVWGESTLDDSESFFTGATQTPCSRRPSYDFSSNHESAWLPTSYLSESTSEEPYIMSPDPLLGDGMPSHAWTGANMQEFCVGGYFVPFMSVGPAPLAESPVSSHGSEAEPASTQTTTSTTTMTSPLALASSSVPDVSSASGGQYSRMVADMSSGSAPALLDPVSLVTSSTEAGRASGHNVQLRTACRKPKRGTRQDSRSSKASGKRASISEDADDSLTAEERRARHSHNLVEKQYRNRLNAQFVRLLAVLPADQRAASSGSGSGDDYGENMRPEERRMSKAEVLDLATRRILSLEEERAKLLQEQNELMHNVDAISTRAPAKTTS